MAEKQLTVAELMARAQQENPETDAEGQPRRRRRRSIEEGGVTVAELTGSFKKVNARPAQVKHSSVPLDDDAAESSESAETVKPDEAVKSDAGVKSAESEAPADEQKVEQKSEEKTAQKSASKDAAEASATEGRSDESPVALTKFRPVQSTPSQAESSQSEADQTAQPAQAAQPAKPEPTQLTSEQPDNADGVTLRKVSRADAVQERDTAEAAETEPATQVQPAVRPEPAEKPAPMTSVQHETPVKRDSSETNVIPVVEDEQSTEPKTAAFAAPVREEAREDVRDRKVEPRQERAEDRLDEARADGAVEPTYEDVAKYDAEVEDTSVNPIMLVLLVFAGLILGVLVFLGFQYLWATMNAIVVAVLAVAATGLIVLLVRAMKTGRDGLTLTLAGVAGAVMTFGPALISAV